MEIQLLFRKLVRNQAKYIAKALYLSISASKSFNLLNTFFK